MTELIKKSRKLTIASIFLAIASFYLSGYTSCYSAQHRGGNMVDCALEPQTFSNLFGLLGYLLVISAVAGTAVGLTAFFAKRKRPRSYRGVIRILLLATAVFILSVPLLYHIAMEYMPYNPWNQTENIGYNAALITSIFILPGLTIATAVAAITCGVFASGDKPS